MIEIIVHPHDKALPAPRSGRVPVHLYGSVGRSGTAAIGGPVLHVLSRIATPIDPVAFDFLSLSLAVTAADTFANRQEAADGWARDIHLKVALAEPDKWRPATKLLERALHFLSGDQWMLEITDGGEISPTPNARVRDRLDFEGMQSASLYSGGLDSAIGMLNLRAAGHKTVLVSHAYRHDASRQEDLLKRLNEPSVRLALHAYPRQQLDYANDVQMRTRSFNFFAMGALVAATLAQNNGKNRQVRLNIPENGLIAINPPLTNRRIGALSTRTTHPYYLGMLQQVFAVVGLGVELHNPFANMTKGEMILKCRDQIALKAIAWRTVSCGKWKRSGQQCGKCVPCLIRRASFHAAAWQDKTPYKAPGDDLHKALTHSADTDDLMAMILAARRLPGQDLLSWVAKSGPLPRDVAERSALVDVVRRGMAEVENFLTSKRVLR